ncbi:MAG: hypothetical protein IIA61_13945 [Candidatus Marinimicrobia bacterium]|nr:hypothetical protein [Candidatus Neomarinimicrobiota bacterium]
MDKNSKTDIDRELLELDEASFRSYAFYIVGKLLALGLDSKKLVDIATDMFVVLMRIDVGYLMLFDEKSRALSIKSVKGLKRKRTRELETAKKELELDITERLSTEQAGKQAENNL